MQITTTLRLRGRFGVAGVLPPRCLACGETVSEPDWLTADAGPHDVPYPVVLFDWWVDRAPGRPSWDCCWTTANGASFPFPLAPAEVGNATDTGRSA